MSADSRQPDIVIIGLGLAGSALAWHAVDAGLDVVIVDDASATAASRVAAGLVTPVTGARLKPQEGFGELTATAVAHYKRVGEVTGVDAYHARPAIRVLSGRKELDAWRELAAAGHPLAARSLHARLARRPDGGRSTRRAGKKPQR